MSQQKKKHHYVPVTYLKGFLAADGKLYVYRKDEPQKILRVIPEETSFQNYYYSQPKPDGTQDNNTIEDHFSALEANFPALIAKLEKSIELSQQDTELLFQFLGLQRVRVPALRDALEIIEAERVLRFAKSLDKEGKLPPQPKIEGIDNLLNHTEVAIDPHLSIHGMVSVLNGFSRVLDMLGFKVLHNTSGIDFITSDNPVVYLDADIPEGQLQPYVIDASTRSIELFFPLTPKLLLYGHTGLRKPFEKQLNGFAELDSKVEVKRINRLIAKFAYQLVIANSSDYGKLVQNHAHHSPVVEFLNVDEEHTQYKMVFGPRKKKPKWKPKLE